MVTIKDVAKKANVSISTISLVLNNKGNVSRKTRERILKVIEELEYYPRRSARGLPSKKCGNIGFILTHDHFSRVEPFYTRIFLGTELEARKHQNYILLTTIPRVFKPPENVPLFLLERNVDGVIVAGWVPDKIIDYIHSTDIPLVLIDFYPADGKHSAVLIDNVYSGKEAVEYLIGLGHRKIGFIGGDIDHPSINERYQGYKQALENAQIPYSDNFIFLENNTTQEDGYISAKKIIRLGEEKPTAYFAANDALAIGCIRGLKEQNIKIPGEVSIIGFDDIEFDLELDPPLTTMRVEKEDLGISAVQKVVDMINNKSPMYTRTRIPAELIKRKSCRRINIK